MTSTHNAMNSTSAVQELAWRNQQVAPPEEVRPGIWAVALPLWGDRMPSSFGYAAFSNEGVDIIDAGWDNDNTLTTWQDFLHHHGKSFGDIRTITVTHHHPDHLGLASKLRELSGATLRMTRIEDAALTRRTQEQNQAAADLLGKLRAWGVPEQVREKLVAELDGSDVPEIVQADELLEDGQQISFGEHLRLTTVITPGHTAGHACFVDENEGLIFTGDHVLPGIAPGIALGRVGDEDPLLGYVEALHKMTEFDECEVLPGHEYRFIGLAERSRQIAAHHLRRTRALSALHAELGDATVWQYAERAPWSNGWHRLSGFLLFSALTQTEQHLFSLRAGRIQPWLDSSWPG